MKDKDIVELFSDGEMTAKHMWLRAYDSESGKEGWVSVESILSDIMKDLEEFKKIDDVSHAKSEGGKGYSNSPNSDRTEWACEKCGVVKETKFKDIIQENDGGQE